MPPTPDQGLARTQRHAHGRVFFASALALDRVFADEHRRLPLVPIAAVGQENAHSVRPLDQVVVPRQIPIAGQGFVVPQQVDHVEVCVHHVPAAVVGDLSDRVRHQADRGALETRLPP